MEGNIDMAETRNDYDSQMFPRPSKRNSLFVSSNQEKRNLWWKAFRRTVLEPHSITILENAMVDKVPPELLQCVEDKCRHLESYESPALRITDTISRGDGLVFATDTILPLLQPRDQIVRCQEPALDQQILPKQEDGLNMPLYELPILRPDIGLGFHLDTLSESEREKVPTWLKARGSARDPVFQQSSACSTMCSPFLLLEKSYGRAKHEVEASMNYCAMNGSAALNAIKMLYDDAWSTDIKQHSVQRPVVFSCIIDNDVGIINHHWSVNGGFFVAPLCKFDFRDLEHLMHFLAWVDAIEEWAVTYLLRDVQTALRTMVDRDTVQTSQNGVAAPNPASENHDPFSRPMRLAFENKPRKAGRGVGAPLGVTGAMRMRSPKTVAESSTETVITPMDLSHPGRGSHIRATSAATSPAFPSSSAVISPSIASIAPVRSNTPRVTDVPTTTASALSTPMVVPTKLEESDNPVQTDDDATSISVASEASGTGVTKKRNLRILDPLIKSAGIVKSPKASKETRPATATTLSNSKSMSGMMYGKMVQNPSSTASPGPATGMSGMKSPSQSISSVQSKRSFFSLRSDKKQRSPTTPEFGSSPKNGLFKSKVGGGLNVIRENTPTKRGWSDNTAPSSGRDMGLPTPAYDKKRFDIKTPRPQLPETPVSMANDVMPPPSITKVEPSGTSKPEGIEIIKYSANDDYHAKHVLPLRQWAKSPTSEVTHTTTIITSQ